MVRHRTHSISFKRQVVQEYLGGEALHEPIMDRWVHLHAVGGDATLQNLDRVSPQAAATRSASSKTMNGALLPVRERAASLSARTAPSTGSLPA